MREKEKLDPLDFLAMEEQQDILEYITMFYNTQRLTPIWTT